jgi:RecA/RadA recombinase
MDYLIKPFNELFDYIFPIKGILSVWGDFGVGKTTFSLQKAISYASGKNKIIYIYTKPNFPLEKINNSIQKSVRNPLDKIIFIKSLNFEDLYSLVFNLEFIVLDTYKKLNTAIELIVIDSITDLYRLELNRESKEKNFLLNYKLNQILANLFFLNKKYSINIIVVNTQTNINQNGQLIEVQSGGKVMDYWIDSSLKILRTNELNCRRFVFKKKNNKKAIASLSTLTQDGFI